MVELTWRKWFEIGNETIDFEHKAFFGIIHKLQCAVERRVPRHEVRRIIEELYKYADFHFTSEENMMADAAYGGAEAHKNLHGRIMIEFKEYIKHYDDGSDNADEIVTFMFSWLVEHTISEDMNLSKFIKEGKVREFFKSS